MATKLEELREARRQSRNKPAVQKCRGRHRHASLTLADKNYKQKIKTDPSAPLPYFCPLCSGYHHERPDDDPIPPWRPRKDAE